MATFMSREIRLASRPTGLPTAANFTLAQTKLPSLQDRRCWSAISSCRWPPTCAGA